MPIKLPLLLLLAATISACGGGGGGSSSPTPTPPPINQNNAPTLSSIGDISIVEGSAAVTTVSGTDSDGDTLVFTLTGADSSLFSVATSGELSFVEAPDFELPGDANGDNVYELTVRVSDPSNASDSESIVVTVIDALDGRVVDGPLRNADVELSATTLSGAQTVITDAEGYFNFGDVTAASGQRIIVSGGTDTFTGNTLANSLLIGVVDDDTQLAQVNALTTVLNDLASGAEKTQVLDALSVAYTAEDLSRSDIWQLAEGGDADALQAQRVNFQLAVLFTAANNFFGDEVTPIDITVAMTEEIVAGATATPDSFSLSNEGTLRPMLTSAVNAFGGTPPSNAVTDAFVAALADLNTVLVDEQLVPISDLARGVNSAVQTAFQASVIALRADNDVAKFETETSLNTLFLGIDAGADTSDIDGDGLADILDADDDDDGVRDGSDAFPADPSESTDTDADGVGDNSDAFPDDASETADSDGDGIGDNGDAFPNDPSETADSDGDGVGDNADAFPDDSSETVDTDGDGVGDNSDAFPNDASETLDSDGDGVGDNTDQFPNDPSESVDTDGDGVGNVADEDDDGDGVNDEDDAAPLNPEVTGFFISGQLIVTPDAVIDSDTNNPDNEFTRNNTVGEFSPNPAIAQTLVSPFILHGYVNKPNAGAAGPLKNEGDDDDFFAVDALAGQRFILDIPDDAQDLDFYLFNEAGAIVDASENPPGFVDADGFQEILTAPSDGRYILNIYAYSFQGFPTASNYTVTTDFKGAPGMQRAVRPGEVIVSLKEGRDKTRAWRSRTFDSVALRHNLEAAPGSQSKVRLMRFGASRKSGEKASLGPKFAALANQGLKDASEVAHIVKALAADPQIEFAEPNFIHHRHATTDDPLLGQMWHLEQVNTSTAWDTTTGAAEVVVAVIDSGTLAQHPDFLGQTTEGYDFVRGGDNYDGDGIDADPEDATPLFDECSDASAFYHGAHVAGTVGATGNNAEGIAGLSYSASLMHLRALNGDCGGSTYDIYQSLLYAMGAENDSGTVPNNPASVVNMSLGGGGANAIFQEGINEAAARGVIVVASSGNAGASTVSYPAAYDNTFAIGATGLTGSVESYSNQGPKLDLVAPGGGSGGGVLSLNKVEDAEGNPELTYVNSQGTSMAAPHAAAIFALMKSVHPTLTPARLEALLAAGVLTDDLDDPGFDNASGWGLLKADKAVEVALADANGTFVMPARLLLSTGRLYFGGNTTTTMISASNPGEVGLEVTGIETSADWVVVSERADALEDEVGRWDVSIDRSGLDSGFYTTEVTYNAVDDEGNALQARLTVALRIGKSSGGDLGTLQVVVIDTDSGSAIATTTASPDNEYNYRIGLVDAGSFQITASTDTNGDEIICENGEACGRFGGLTSPAALEAAESTEDVDIVVRLPAEP